MAPHKELAHYLGHAVEVTGAHGAFHHIGNRAEVEGAGIGLGIYLLYRRDKHIVDSCPFEQRAVGFLCAGISGRIGRIVKLCGIDKHRYYHDVVFAARTVNQRDMTGVQSTHCRDKTYGHAL